MLSVLGCSIPSQGCREMSRSPWATALGLAVLLEQGVARSEAVFRGQMRGKLAQRDFLITTTARLGSLPCCP